MRSGTVVDSQICGKAEDTVTRANARRRIRLCPKFHDAPGEAKSDGWIIANGAGKTGFDGFDWRISNDVLKKGTRHSRGTRKDFNMFTLANCQDQVETFLGAMSIDRLSWREAGSLRGRERALSQLAEGTVPEQMAYMILRGFAGAGVQDARRRNPSIGSDRVQMAIR